MAESAPADAKLYAVYLGGEVLPGRMGEDHEVVFVVAADVKAARTAGKRKWKGAGRAHVDAVAEIGHVDGHDVVLRPSEAEGDVAIDATYVP